MDLTSLSSNLPRSGNAADRSSSPIAPDENEPSSSILMASFKAAALSVTTLYKNASEQAERSRRDGRLEGYNDALDDVLTLVSTVESQGRADSATAALIREWALNRKRHSNIRRESEREREREREKERERERERSDDSGEDDKERDRSAVDMGVPQVPIFAFRADPMPLPRENPMTMAEIEELTGQYQQTPQMGPQQQQQQQQQQHQHPHQHQQSQLRRQSTHRGGQKRRVGAGTEFFEVAGLQEKLKKGRFQ